MADVVFIALGSNLGNRGAYLDRARVAVSLIPGVALLATSRVEETAPLGAAAQPPYLNQMIAVAATLEPEALLARLQVIESSLGRIRAIPWGARTIDLDIVRFGERTLASATLQIPHPGIATRGFWQREIQELSGARHLGS